MEVFADFANVILRWIIILNKSRRNKHIFSQSDESNVKKNHVSSVTSKKSPNVYKSCPKWYHLKNERILHCYNISRKCG